MKWWTADDVAECLHINKQTAYRYGREGIIDRYKVGGLVRFYPVSPEEVRNRLWEKEQKHSSRH